MVRLPLIIYSNAAKNSRWIPPPLREPTERQSGDTAAAAWLESAEKSAADKQDFEKNVVKTFGIFKPKSTIYTPNCGTWVKVAIGRGVYYILI